MEETRYYITLEDWLKSVLDETTYATNYMQLELGNVNNISTLTFVNKFINELYGISLAATDVLTKADVNQLFCCYIYPKYKDMCIAYGKDDTELRENCMKFQRQLNNKIKTTYDEHKELLTYYANIKNHLMDEVKSQIKYNDTPQTQTVLGVTSYDDRYNSNVSTTYNEGNTKISRFDEISKLIYDVYDRWMNAVCKGLFIYD